MAKKSLLIGSGMGLLLIAAILLGVYAIKRPTGDGAWASYSFEEGDQRTLDLSFSQVGTFKMQFAAGLDNNSTSPELALDIKFQGKAVLTVVRVDADEGALLSVKFEPKDLEFTFGSRQAALEKAIRQELLETVGIEVSNEGEIRHFLFPKITQSANRNFQRLVLSHLIPLLRDGSHSTKGLSGNEHFEQSHSCEGDDCTVTKVLKSIDLIDSRFSPSISGTWTYALDDETSGINKIEGSRTLAISKDGTYVKKDEIQLSAALSARATLSQTTVTGLRNSLSKVKSSIDGKEEFKEAERMQMAQLIEGKDLRTELEAVNLLPREVTISEMMELYRKLLAFAVLHPEDVNRIGEELQRYKSDDNRFDILGVVLAKCGTEVCQAELVKYIRELWADPRAVEVLSSSLALMEEPGAEAIRALKAVYEAAAPQEESRDVLLGNLASMGFHSEDQGIKDELKATLMDRWTGSTAAPEKAFVSMALGNLGHDDNLALAQQLVKSPDEIERSRAAEVIRRIKGAKAPETTSLLVGMSSEDPSVKVRRAASQWMVGRDLPVKDVGVVSTRLREEKDQGTVMNYIDALAKSPEATQLNKTVLEDFYKQCGTPNVCKKVEQAILGQ